MNNAMQKNKATSKPAPAAPKKAAIDVLARDEFAGKGGSYIFDPITGTRSPAPQPEATPLPSEKE